MCKVLGSILSSAKENKKADMVGLRQEGRERGPLELMEFKTKLSNNRKSPFQNNNKRETPYPTPSSPFHTLPILNTVLFTKF
jgi:hypothetical protein